MAVQPGTADYARIRPARFLMVWIRLNGASTDVFGFDGKVVDRIEVEISPNAPRATNE